MRTTHGGRIRVILIDPPYNTGNNDFVYNDHYINKDDSYRQSTWLDWIYRRLKIARDLLSNDGVILVCINDENRAKLELLMDEVFPGMRVGSFVWRSRIGGNDASGRNFSSNHEHVLIYGNTEFCFGGTIKSDAHYRFDDNDGCGPWFPDNLTQSKSYLERPNAYYGLQNPDTGVWYPANPNRGWAFATKANLKEVQKTRKATIEQIIDEKKVIWPKGERVEVWTTLNDLLDAIDRKDVPFRGGVPILRRDLPDLEFWINRPIGWGSPKYKRHKNELKSILKPVSSWVRTKTDEHNPGDEIVEISSLMGESGTTLLNKLFGEKVFNYPKPLSLIKDLLSQVMDKDDIVCDFFAGTGTTAHAVLQLNNDDDGDRRFILVSSTEALPNQPERNLCRDVCAERLRRVIEGYGREKGLGGEFAYLQVVKLIQADLPFDLTTEMAWNTLCLKHGVGIAPMPPERIKRIPCSDDAVILFCPDTDEETLAAIRMVKAGELIIYTDRPDAVREVIMELAAVDVRDINAAIQTAIVSLEDE